MSTLPMLPSQVKMFLPMGIMWGYNRFGTELSPNVLRAAYTFSQIFAVASALYIWSRAEATASTTEKLTVKTKQPTGPEKEEVLTIKEYDVKEVKATLGKLFTGAALVCGLHAWKGFLQPLLIQAVMGIIVAIDEPLFRIYVLGAKPVGHLARPFKKDVSPFAALLGQDKPAEPAAPAAEGEEAEAEDEAVAPAGTANGNGGAASTAVKPSTAVKRNIEKIR